MDLSYKNKIATRFLIVFLIFMILVNKSSFAAEKSARGDYQTEGSTTIFTHFVNKGLSHSQQDPSLQTNMFIPLGPQFRIGLWGSNVSYENSDNHIWLKVLFDLRLEFNKDVDLIIGYNINQFYKNRVRNGNDSVLSLNIFDFHIRYENESNWEGTDTRARYVSFGKSFKIYNNVEWDNQLGYSMVSVENLQSYFDIRSTLSSTFNKLEFLIAVTATSNPGQFNGRGDVFGILGMGFKY